MDEEKIPYERLKQILCNYISNDAEAIELSYVRDILRDVCGCDDDEIIELGFSYLLDCADEDENDE